MYISGMGSMAILYPNWLPALTAPTLYGVEAVSPPLNQRFSGGVPLLRLMEAKANRRLDSVLAEAELGVGIETWGTHIVPPKGGV